MTAINPRGHLRRHSIAPLSHQNYDSSQQMQNANNHPKGQPNILENVSLSDEQKLELFLRASAAGCHIEIKKHDLTSHNVYLWGANT